MIGQTISHYQILEKLGEGGMGVVYKAHDTKLGRLVALKFLPHGILVSEEDKARFLQEARAASAVMHPNVCVIYDIAEHEGQQFIVMEFVDGKTLRQMIPVQKIQDAITYAIQIGEALQEAHSKGVVHRDVKTDNIMVNTKNQIKVMDFGLAKLKGSLKLTRTSSTVGTLAYMAPEQIQGGEVDARSDIFSFGVVLYEMLTGHMPFRGEHEAAMVYSIVNEEPLPIQKYLPDISSELVHILSRALEKDAEDRYQTVHDMVIDLRRLKKETSKVHRAAFAETASAERLAAEPRPSSTKKKVAWIGACVVVLALIAVALVILLQRPPKFNPNATLRAFPVPLGPGKNPSLSSDGNWIAFAGYDQGLADIYVIHVSGGELRRVTKDSAGFIGASVISPDGSQIVYSRTLRGQDSRHREIAIVSFNGGISRKIAEVGTNPIWRPDGKRVGYYRGGVAPSESGKSEFWTMKPDGSDKRLELRDSTSALATGAVAAVCWSPDGKSIAWSRTFPDQTQELITHELGTGKERQLTSDGKPISDIVWTPQNMIIFSSSRGGPTNLWMISPEGGEPVQITRGPGTDLSGLISEDGRRFVYTQGQGVSQLWTINPDGSDLKQITFADERILDAAISPDRKLIAMVMGDPDYHKNERHLFVMDRATGSRQQLTSGDEYIQLPFWSPDAKWIAFGWRTLQEPTDSTRICLLEVKNPENRRVMGKGYYIWWLNATEFLIARETQYWRSSITGSDFKPCYEDSTYTIPFNTPAGNYFFIDDHRYDRRGLWILTEERQRKQQQPTKLISEIPGYRVSYDGKVVDFLQGPDEWWRMSLPSGKRTFIRKWPPNGTGVDRSYDGKEYLLTMTQGRMRLMLIEDLFK